MKENRSKENYLKTIYKISKEKEVRSFNIAEEMGVSRPSVCNALQELNTEGFTYTDEAHNIYLTETGYHLAKDTYDRNLLFKELLISLGVEEKIAKQDACEAEHLLSEETFSALKMWSQHK